MSASNLPERFEALFGHPPSIVARAPGRVNLLGEHVDYNAGLALPCGIQFTARLAMAKKTSGPIHLAALDLGAEHVFEMADLEASPEQLRASTPDWARYPVGVCWAWAHAGHRLVAWDASYSCDVPPGSGLSSSAAVEVAFAAALCSLLEVDLPDLDLARLCQTAEHAMVGVHSGLMDQWTSVSALKDHALLLDFQDLTAHPVLLPSDIAIVVADTGVRRALATSAYNQRVEECHQAVTELRKEMPGVRSLRDITPEAFAGAAEHLSQPARRRAQHVIDEIERVRQGVACMQRGDAAGFGALMRASHASLRDLYQVSGPELDKLVELANQLDGAFGSRLTGAGFAGATVHLVQKERAADFCSQLAGRYLAETGQRAGTWICRAESGAEVDNF